jgi:hypothetical protein
MRWTVAIGVDTHKEVHVAVALDPLGAQLDSLEIATTAAGYRSLVSWAHELGMPAFAVEVAWGCRLLKCAGGVKLKSAPPERRRGKAV